MLKRISYILAGCTLIVGYFVLLAETDAILRKLATLEDDNSPHCSIVYESFD